jgi:hypothetical protein
VTEATVRYGVFLMPDAKTSAAVTTITRLLRAQFGLVSADRFPPHVTLAGSLPLAVEEPQLITILARLTAGHPTLPMYNRGLQRLGDAAVVFDVHHDASGRPNTALINLAQDVTTAVRPLLARSSGLPPDVQGRSDWRGHLSLASHDLIGQPDLRNEVEAFIRDLDQPYPPSFQASKVILYRLQHPNWSGSWWRDFEWTYIRTFDLGN